MSVPPAKAVDTATRERALRDVLVQIGSRVLNLALGVVVTALVVRTLGDNGFGQWATMLVIFEVVGYLMRFGLDQVVVREASARPEETRDWVGALLLVRTVLAVPTTIAAGIVLLLISESDEMTIAGLILLVQFPVNVVSSLQVVHTLRMHNTIPMVVLTINSVTWGVAVIAIYAAGGGMVALALAMSGAMLLSSLVQAVASLRLIGVQLTPTRHAVRRLLRVGIPIGVSGLLVTSYARIDQVLVFEIAGTREAGLYGAVYRILDQAHFIPLSVLTTLSPVIASAWPDQRTRMLRVVRLAMELLTIGSLGALAFAIVASEPVVELIFGAEFIDAAPALPVLGGAFVLVCFSYLTGNLLLVLGLADRMVIVAALALVANVIGNVLLIPPYGFMGAAWITLVTEVVVVAASLWFIHTRIDLREIELARLGRIVLGAVLLGLLLGGLDALGAPLGVLAAAAAIAYPLLLLALRGVEIAELRTLTRLRGAG